MFKKNKVGILTFHRAINYGAILQVYALQRKIKENNINCEIVDYRNKKLENKHKKISFIENISPKGIVKYLLLYRNANKKHEKFNEFRRKYLNIGDPYYKIEELKEINRMYDKILVGSDQVWNYSIHDMDPVYLLDFVDDNYKRNSYAASFGLSSIPNDLKHKYKDSFLKFNKITVREKQAACLIRSITGSDPEVVLDPTLLLNKNEWKDLIMADRFIKDKYILLYGFSGSKYLIELAKYYSEKNGYRIVFIQNTYKNNKGIQYIKNIGPIEWLNLFINAEMILTNSFHGTAFSINFNKQFFTEMLPEEYGVNSRLEDILDLFDLSSRKIESESPDIFQESIDYQKVNLKLEKERKKSLVLLKDILN